MNDPQPFGSFDRIVSVEMFEHIRKCEDLRRRIGPCLAPDGRLFLHGFAAQARRWLQRWRTFFLACAEVFGVHDGNEWLVAHHRLKRAASPGRG